MDYESEIVTFLSKRENVGLALDVAEHIDAVKDRLVTSFWSAALNHLRKRLGEVDGWIGKRSDHYKFTQAWGGLSVHPTGLDRFYVYPRAEQTGSGRVYYGIWKHETPESLAGEEAFQSLQAKLRAQGFTRQSHASAGHQDFDFEVQARSTLVEVASGEFHRSKDIGDALAGLFFDARAELEAVNRLAMGS